MPKSASLAIEEHEAEESYFVSMTDIMVGLLFIFIIIIMYFALQIRNESVVSKAIHDDVVAERDDLRAKFNELVALNQKFRLQIQELQAEREELHDSVKDHQHRITVLDKVIEELQAERKELHDNVKDHQRRIMALDKEIKELRVERKELHDSVKDHQHRIVALNKKIEELLSKSQHLEVQIVTLTKENIGLRTEIRKLNREVSRVLDELGLRQTNYPPTKEPKSSLVDEVAALVAMLEKFEKDALNNYIRQADNRMEQILKEMQTLMENAGFEVEIIPEQGILRLSNNLLFPNAKSEIVAGTSADEAAQNLARALKAVLPCFTLGEISDGLRNRKCNPSSAFVEAVLIEGHTDNVPILGEIEPGVRDNLDLSARRATNTYRRLVKAEPGLIKFQSVERKPVLNIAAFGETRPIADNSTKKGREQNRRIDIRILMFTPRSENIAKIQELVPEQ